MAGEHLNCTIVRQQNVTIMYHRSYSPSHIELLHVATPDHNVLNCKVNT
jgi:hypothetical protein